MTCTQVGERKRPVSRVQAAVCQNAAAKGSRGTMHAVSKHVSNTSCQICQSAHPSREMGARGRSENQSMTSCLVQLKGSPRSFSMPADGKHRAPMEAQQILGPSIEVRVFAPEPACGGSQPPRLVTLMQKAGQCRVALTAGTTPGCDASAAGKKRCRTGHGLFFRSLARSCSYSVPIRRIWLLHGLVHAGRRLLHQLTSNRNGMANACTYQSGMRRAPVCSTGWST